MTEPIVTQEMVDKMCEDFETLKIKAGAWWPTVHEINTYLTPVIKEKMAFAIWIMETATPPQTEEEQASRKALARLIYNNIEEDPEEKEEESEDAKPC